MERRCFQCGKYGHIARNCQGRDRQSDIARMPSKKGASLVVQDVQNKDSDEAAQPPASSVKDCSRLPASKKGHL